MGGKKGKRNSGKTSSRRAVRRRWFARATGGDPGASVTGGGEAVGVKELIGIGILLSNVGKGGEP